ncbi:hypothetical protein JM16_005673 [Phytophthora kernoviae]|uniref:N-acetyltransferase domain-containing protein n=1 Tax=Phytophthora kernoviae TaxID=325452 RepID=A0A8T0LUG8_9STRA|nr:hypothetical protein JM16_005673 [Phytophthora kernoviae]
MANQPEHTSNSTNTAGGMKTPATKLRQLRSEPPKINQTRSARPVRAGPLLPSFDGEDEKPQQMKPTNVWSHIRQFRDDDLPQVVEIFEYGMMLYSDDPALNHRWVDYVRKSIKGDLADVYGTYIAPGGNFWVATLQDSDGQSKIVGMIGLEAKSNSQGEVRRVSVHHDYHRLGIARQLMTNLTQWATTRHFKSLMLIASHARKSALNFYSSCGFENIENANFWENPTYVGYLLVKTLP